MLFSRLKTNPLDANLLIDTVGTNEESTSLEEAVEVATQQQQQTNPPVTMDQQLPDLAAKLTNPASSSTDNEDISIHAVDSLDSFQQAKASHNEESYDNLNSAGLIEASYIIEDDEEQESYDNDKQVVNEEGGDEVEASLREELSLIEANARPMDDQALNDFLNKSNTTSFIFANGRYMSKSQFATGSSLHEQSAASSHSSASNQPNQNDTNQVSEEIEDDEEEMGGQGAEQTTMSEDMLRTFDSYVAGEGGNEDEFFLISTPSPYGLGLIGARQLGGSGGEADDGEEEEEDDDDEDEDEVYDQQLHQKPVNMLR